MHLILIEFTEDLAHGVFLGTISIMVSSYLMVDTYKEIITKNCPECSHGRNTNIGALNFN